MANLLLHPLAWLGLLFAALLGREATASNAYPIILVNGFGGWGRDELGGFKYWGSFYGDWQAQLVAEGYDVRTAVVGPFSSDWDRACELYAYIKGGTVNYGANHSKHHGHNATGRTFAGIFPEWGTTVNGSVQKVHLVGHSMGGQTIRMMAQMLATGTTGAPIAESASASPLFAGGHDWIHSITTISSPNQGTTLADGFNELGTSVIDLIAGIATLSNAVSSVSSSSTFYDAKLDQWGIAKRSSSESMSDYIERVFSSALFSGTSTDHCFYSLSSVGAKEENTWVTTLSNVYYYSFSTQNTYSWVNLKLKKIALPRASMLVLLWPLSTFMGSRYTVDTAGHTDSWLANDGAVNTASMKSDGAGAVVEYSSASVKGRWHHVALLDTVDHECVVGLSLLKNVFSVYSAQAALLQNLPKASNSRRALRGAAKHEEEGVHEAPKEIIDRLQQAVQDASTTMLK